ncbi:MAG: TspO/MBR family protein [Bradymonadaceae bacterium]
MRSIIALIISIAIPELIGLLGAWATATSVSDWYPTLNKPWFTPPNWLFGPAWTTLYALMGIAAYLVWSHGSAKGAVKIALAAYLIQLLLNATWSPVFFGLQAPGPGLVVIVLLWIAIVVTITWFARVSTIAAWLMVPYLLWVTYATALNVEIWRLN